MDFAHDAKISQMEFIRATSHYRNFIHLSITENALGGTFNKQFYKFNVQPSFKIRTI
jgi:hypothetical protein